MLEYEVRSNDIKSYTLPCYKTESFCRVRKICLATTRHLHIILIFLVEFSRPFTLVITLLGMLNFMCLMIFPRIRDGRESSVPPQFFYASM